MSVEDLSSKPKGEKEGAILPLRYGDRLRGITATAEMIKAVESKEAAEEYLKEHFNSIDEDFEGHIPSPKGSPKLKPSDITRVALKLQTMGTEKVAEEKKVVASPEALTAQVLKPVVEAELEIDEQLDEFGLPVYKTDNPTKPDLGDRFEGKEKVEEVPKRIVLPRPSEEVVRALQTKRSARTTRMNAAAAFRELLEKGINTVKNIFKVEPDKRSAFKEMYPNLELEMDGSLRVAEQGEDSTAEITPVSQQQQEKTLTAFELYIQKHFPQADPTNPLWAEKIKVAARLFDAPGIPRARVDRVMNAKNPRELADIN
jgi:hypothetical protein